jgi:hypothetical protein
MTHLPSSKNILAVHHTLSVLSRTIFDFLKTEVESIYFLTKSFEIEKDLLAVYLQYE